ncbi:MAG TPA: hypothetical protein VNJ54_14825 [Plantibacter sp.]|uniref:hypothetical protein n=1 Tax=unclassified Plantibacter TaxID=2624265 RepID=UPI002CF5250A|nr:hypothetical protein [Plantibacter sp.]
MDQRYDPAFQRGHTAERARPVAVEGGHRSHLASLEEIAPQLIQAPTDGNAVRPPVDDRFDDDGPRTRVQPFQPGAGVPGAARESSVLGTSPSAAAPGPTPEELQRWADEDEEARAAHHTRAKTWERALWAIGIVLTVGGCVGLWQSFTILYRGFVGDSGPTDNYLWMQFLGALAPSLIIVGLATLVALLFRRMLHHDRRSRP